MDEPQAGPESASDGASGEPAADAVDHLRAAAHELIGAVRGFLDIAEELVDDPKAADAVVDTVTTIAEAARRGARSAIHDVGAAGASGSDDHYEHIDMDD
jgi:hypothetical protein